MTEKQIIEITKLDGYKVHFLYHDGEPRVIDFEELFKDWVTEDDMAYPLKQSLTEFQKIGLAYRDNAFLWSDIRIVNKISENGSWDFPYALSVRYEFTKADKSSEHLGYAIEGFASEIINDCKSENEHLHYKVVFLLLLYIAQNAFHLFKIRIWRGGEKVFSSLEEAYYYMLEQMNIPKPNSIQDSIAVIKDKIEKHTVEEGYEHIAYKEKLINSYYYWIKPIYVQGIKKALKIPHVNHLFGKILLLLGIKSTCENCTYEGHFIHAYKCRCNEFYNDGWICPQCHSWSNMGTVLMGLFHASVLMPMYRESNLIKYIFIEIGQQILRICVPVDQSRTLPYAKLKTIIAETINNNIFWKTEVIQPSWFQVNIKNGEVENEILKLDTATEIRFELHMNDTAPNNLAEFESLIIQESTDIDW